MDCDDSIRAFMLVTDSGQVLAHQTSDEDENLVDSCRYTPLVLTASRPSVAAFLRLDSPDAVERVSGKVLSLISFPEVCVPS